MSDLSFALRGGAGGFRLDAAYDGPAGGITAIWGQSGSGKTSLLRALAGLTRLDGNLRFGDTVWQDGRRFVPAYKRRIGLVFQEASLFPHLSVQGNLDYARKRNGGAKVDVEGIIDLLGVRPLLNRGVGALSGGERQRVSLARTLFSAPRLLLMDEPLSSLDATAKAAILPLISDISQRVPILYVSHDLSEVAALADRVLRMEAGVLSVGEVRQSLDGLTDAQVRALAEAALKAGFVP